MKKLTYKNTFFFNTMLVIISGFLIKILGLINKIIITRNLGTEGMTIYIMSFPTIILFLNISTLNINNTISKLVSESLVTKKYSLKKLIFCSLKITFLTTLITSIIFLIILKPLTTHFLKNENLFYPLLTTLILLPLTAITDTLKGYYNGLKKMSKTTFAQTLEQLTRIIFVILIFIFFKNQSIIFKSTLTLLALSIGELFSASFLIIKIKKENLTDFPSPNPTKEILNLSIPSTISKLIGSFTYFLEPIVYTWILTVLNYSDIDIQNQYTIINAYTIPLLSSASFVAIALSTTIIPSISENYALKKYNSINYLIQKIIIFSLIPSILISILLFVYPNEFMYFIYNTKEGTSFIKPTIFFFIFHYLHMPFVSILHAIGQTKIQFIVSTAFSFMRIILIILFSLIPSIGLNSIFYAIIITMILNSATIILLVFKYTNFHINYQSLLTIFLISLLTIFTCILLKNLITNFILTSIIASCLYLGLAYSFNLIDIKSLKKS